jgi:hypothetical protein
MLTKVGLELYALTPTELFLSLALMMERLVHGPTTLV